MAGRSVEESLNGASCGKHIQILEFLNVLICGRTKNPFLRKSKTHFLCKRNAFKTTETELKAIAPPAIQGARKPAAAIGIPSAL